MASPSSRVPAAALGLLLLTLLPRAGAAQPPAVPPEGSAAAEAPAASAADPAPGDSAPELGRWRRTGRTVAHDFGSLYAVRPLLRVAGALAIGGAMANSSVDEEIQDWYREDVRSESTDDLASSVEGLGDGEVAAAFLLMGVAGELTAGAGDPAGAAGRGVPGWVRRTGRSAIIGLPAVYYLQQMTGGNRPSDGLGSGWEPFDGSHGVSGHTFLGAVPFLTLARMSDNAAVDAAALLASGLAGWARLNDDQHYLSQVLLGWYLAWEATGAVERSHRRATAGPDEPAYAITPVPLPDGGAVRVSLSF